MLRLILILFSINPGILFLSALPTSYQCLLVVQVQEKSRFGVMMKMKKITQKVSKLKYTTKGVDASRILDAKALDIWVLEQFRTLFRNATADHLLDSQLRGDKVVFFLHLLGLYTTGHSYRPHSKVKLFCQYLKS
jgi:hypothetical protein